MDILDVLFARSPSLDEAEEELGRPSEAEAKDLPLHVDRCADRWKLSYRLSKTNNTQLSQLRLFMVLLFIYLVFTNPRFLALFGG